MKSKTRRVVLIVVVVLLLVILVGPFFVPVPALKDTLPPQALADPDSEFVNLNGLDIHLKRAGQGEPVFVLLHGFGASLYSWQPVMAQFSQLGTAIAFDRPGFGLTERPLSWEGDSPYSAEAQVDLVISLLDHYGIENAILVGNSAGGAIAMQTALAHPDRVSALILVDPAVYNGGGAPGWTRPLLATPQIRHIGPLIARQIEKRGPELIKLAWHNPGLVTAQTLELYKKPLRVENWDKALWEMTLASRASRLAEKLDQFSLPTLVITGDDDRIVPTSDSLQLASALPNAQLVVIPNAGHVPHEEQPERFMQAVESFMNSLQK